MRPSTLLIIIALFATRTIAQQAMLDPTVRWDETGGYAGIVNGHQTYSYFLDGDTLINGTTYYKVQRTGVDSMFMWQQSPFPPFEPVFQFVGTASMDDYMGALREDVTARKWYLVPVGWATELLFYDFDLVVGSTITGTFGNCPSDQQVDYMDQVMVDGQLRNRYHVLTSPNRYFIEGVGMNSGLFGNYCQAIESGHCMQVYHHGSDSLVVDGCAQLVTGIRRNTGSDMQLSPNPAHDQVMVNGVTTTVGAALIDGSGRTCRTLQLRAGRNILALADLSTGPYLLRLATGEVLRFTKE